MGPGEHALDKANRQRPVCYLDLDGVVCDFVGGALRLHGKELAPNEVEWDFCTQIGFNGVNDPAFWDGMGQSFWAGLEWTPEGPDLVKAIEAIFGENVALMTSPCLTPGGVEGKVEWVAKHMPAYRRRLFVGPAKHLAAGPHKILVDDHDANCWKFREYGGAAVMVPRPWNPRKGETDESGRFRVSGVASELLALVS